MITLRSIGMKAKWSEKLPEQPDGTYFGAIPSHLNAGYQRVSAMYVPVCVIRVCHPVLNSSPVH